MIKTKLKVGDAVKVITGQWRGAVDHIYQVDRSKGVVYLQKSGLRFRFDRLAPQNEKGDKVKEVRRGVNISNVAYYSPEHKKTTKIGFQEIEKKKDNKIEKVKVRTARKFKDKKGNNLLID